MKTVTISLAIAAGALFVSGANAAPLSTSPLMVSDNGIENVRLVCDEYGRCYRSRGGRRVIIQRGYDSYNYGPRERYIERRGYYDGGYYDGGYYGGGPSVGIGVGPGGVGIGFGAGPRW